MTAGHETGSAIDTVAAQPRNMFWLSGRMAWLNLVVLLGLAMVPVLANVLNQPFYYDIATRLVCLAIAAVSLNLVLGYGGMVSFGHAALIGIGAYAVGIPVHHSIYGEWDLVASSNGFFHIALAIVFSALFAFTTGLICLRTRGVYFIMITMAFAQMVYFFFVSLASYGGDDGLVIISRSEFPGIDLSSPIQLYLLCFGVLLAVLYIVHRIVNSRFGMVLQAAKSNEARMRSLGYNVYAYRLVAYTISGALCGLGGAMLGNFTTFITPEMMGWTRSGELMFMVILGGAGTLIGPVVGTAMFVLVEEVFKDLLSWVQEIANAAFGLSLPDLSIYWHLPFGLMLIFVVLFIRGGVARLVAGEDRS